VGVDDRVDDKVDDKVDDSVDVCDVVEVVASDVVTVVV
jgi:hypothetical protein